MSRRTTTTKGLSKPHKGVAPVRGIGSGLKNARTINTEQGGHNPKVGTGLPSTYYGNSKACGSTDRGQH